MTLCHVLLLQDLAILTTDVQRCVYYEQESENVKGRGMCVMPREFLLHYSQDNSIVVPNTKDQCNVSAARDVTHPAEQHVNEDTLMFQCS